jgi:hypothetical protein
MHLLSASCSPSGLRKLVLNGIPARGNDRTSQR